MKEKEYPHNNLRRERIKCRLTQEELAEKIGVEPRTVRRWEGGSSIRPSHTLKLTQFFKQSVEELGLIEEIPNTLPIQFTSLPLIGREQEMTDVKQILSSKEVRLLTLTGPGGTGKTHLSVQVAAELRNIFIDGIFFVDLVPIRDSTLVVATIIQTLKIKDTGKLSLLESLKTYLYDKQILLVMDNFEQLTSAAALQMVDILSGCPKLKMLVTSREKLHVQAEHLYPVSSLSFPKPSPLLTSQIILQYAAVSLLVLRIKSVKSDFQATDTNAQVLAKICSCLDGLPLAIELVAPRIQLFTLQAILIQLNHDVLHLNKKNWDVDIRHRTLYDTIAWSYNLLDVQEQRLFRQISIFVGSCTIRAVETIYTASDQETLSIPDGVLSLLDKSLLKSQNQVDEEEQRITMLQTVRAYGLERLVASEEIEVIRLRHALFYVELAEVAEPKLIGAEERDWLKQLELEYVNLQAALMWLLEQGNEKAEMALRLGGALWRFWWARGYLSEGRTYLEQALSRSGEVVSPVWAKALNAAGMLAGLQGDYEQAEQMCRKSLILFKKLESEQGIATSLNILGQVATWRSTYVLAVELEKEALKLFSKSNDEWGIASSLRILATASFNQGEYDRAYKFAKNALKLSTKISNIGSIAHSYWLLALVVLFKGDFAESHSMLIKSLKLSEELDDKRGIADAHVILAYVSSFQRDYKQMRLHLEESMELHEEVGDQRGIALGLYGQGWLFFIQKDFKSASNSFEKSLALLRKLGHQWFVALCLEGLACTASSQTQLTRAAQLWSAVELLRKTIGAPPPPLMSELYRRLRIDDNTNAQSSK